MPKRIPLVYMLAQFPMSPVQPQLTARAGVPMLTAPDIIMQKLSRLPGGQT
jgi:hypothetical protein